jgi:hypothetical protein
VKDNDIKRLKDELNAEKRERQVWFSVGFSLGFSLGNAGKGERQVSLCICSVSAMENTF